MSRKKEDPQLSIIREICLYCNKASCSSERTVNIRELAQALGIFDFVLLKYIYELSGDSEALTIQDGTIRVDGRLWPTLYELLFPRSERIFAPQTKVYSDTVGAKRTRSFEENRQSGNFIPNGGLSAQRKTSPKYDRASSHYKELRIGSKIDDKETIRSIKAKGAIRGHQIS